jgi:hypothetical protein
MLEVPTGFFDLAEKVSTGWLSTQGSGGCRVERGVGESGDRCVRNLGLEKLVASLECHCCLTLWRRPERFLRFASCLSGALLLGLLFE